MMKSGSRAVALEPIGSTAMRVCASLLIAMCTAGAASASAQTLADVARTENDRRQTVKGSGGKTWTNQDLKPVPGAPAEPESPAAEPAEPQADAADAAPGVAKDDKPAAADAKPAAKPDDKALSECFSADVASGTDELETAGKLDLAKDLLARFKAVCPDA